MSDLVELKVAGMLYSGWKSVRIETGIEQCAGAFDLSVSDRWTGQDQPWPIKPGQACELRLNGDTILTGYVDETMPAFGKDSHGIRVSGRDKAADLIDCSAIVKTGQWKGAKLSKIAADVARPFGIAVVLVPGTNQGAAFDSFNIEEGERAFETIERAARMRGVLVMSDGLGRVLLTSASKKKDARAFLAEGVNVLEASLALSWKDRYSSITVKGQGKGSASAYGAAVAHGTAKVTDDAINRYRPLIVIAEQHGLSPTFAARAEWERNVRRGRGTRGTVRVPGWSFQGQGDAVGGVWRPNMLIPTDIPYLGLRQDLLAARCVYTKDQSGTFTELQLADPSAFQLLNGVRGTPLGRRILGDNGLESKRRHARTRAKAKSQSHGGTTIDAATGTETGEDE